MKRIYAIKALCTAALLGSVCPAGAQEDVSKEKNLNREMTLEREYDPSVQDASKVNTLPVVKEPEVRKIPIDYATFTIPAEPAKEIGLLPPGSVMTQMAYDKRRGYFNFGGGTYLNLNGDAGYHILSTEKDELNIWFSHRSTNGKVKYIDTDEKIKAKLNDNLGGLDFRHAFTRLDLLMGVKYGYSAFNYYGLPLGYTASSVPSASDRETNQGAQTIQVHAGVQAKEEAPVGYLLDVAYTNFSRKYGFSKDMDGATENAVDVRFDLNAGFNGDMTVGLGGAVSYFNYSLPGGMPNLTYFNRNGSSSENIYKLENRADITLSPYYKVEGENWHIRLGANVMLYTGDNHKFMASPNIAADVTVADKTVLYLKADGKLYANSMYQLARVNRYMSPVEGVTPSRGWLDAVLGLKCGAAPGFWFDVFAGYKKTSDDVFFTTNGGYVPGGFGNFSSVYPLLDSDQLFAGINLKYSYQQLFDISVKGVYNHWKVESNTDDTPYLPADGELKAFGKPKMELTASLDVKPMRNLSFLLDYYLATDRYASVQRSTVKMDAINELNLTGSYTFNDTFGVYARLNNILCQKYEVIYGYPLQSFSAMVGVNINF